MRTQGILKPVAIHAQLLIVIGLITVAVTSVSRAGLVGPYTVDNNTLHLWHFDENNGTPADAPTNGLCFDSVTANPQTSPLVLSNTPGPVSDPNFAGYPPTSFVLMGQPAFSIAGYVDYSNAIDGLNISSCFYAPWTNAPGNSQAQPDPTYTNLNNYVNPTSGAFTFEALLKPNFDPLNPPTTMEIICGDSSFSKRAWQFRFNAGRLEFNDINGSNPHQIFATLPNSGPDAAVQGNWYHIALTFTGNNPTNGDTPDVFKFYWTLLDPTRTNADVLWATNLAGNLHGSGVFLAIGGNGRGSPVNSVAGLEGFVGSMDEVRISDVCRKSTEMVFNTDQFLSKPIIAIANTNYVVGYGQTLTIPTTIFGTTPVTNQWFKDGVALPGQTNTALIISNITFAANGDYELMSTNALGSATSVVCQVTVGAAFQHLFNTGVDDNGNPVDETAGGSFDLHWFLTSSPDPNATVPYAVVLSDPLPTGPGYPQNGPLSAWIGSENRPPTYPGTYTYQTGFQIDQGDPASAALSCKVLAYGPNAGATMQTYLNGVETDIPLSGKPISLPTYFVLTNGLQSGSNTLVLTIPYTTGNPMAFRAELTGIGNALPPGLPVIANPPPATETVQYGSIASIPIVALGRPPLSYQWLSNGVAIDPIATPSAATPDLSFVATNFNPSQLVGGSFSANYQIVVSNDSGSVTSSVDTLTIQLPALTIASAGVPIWNPANNETNIIVIFSTAVDAATATTVGNYSLDNSSSVLSATMGDAPNKVILGTSVLTPGTAYTLTVQNVQDAFGDTMSPSPASASVGLYPAATVLWVKANTGVTTDANGVNQWNDLSGNGNDLLNSSGYPYEPQLATNVFGDPVIRFAATNETFMSANDSPTLEITNDMTIFAVVNFATLAGGTNGMIVSKTAPSIPAPYDYYVNSTAVRLYRGNGTADAVVNSTNVPSIGIPHLLDVMMQGTNVTHRLDGEVNGIGALSTKIADTGQPLYIGTRADVANRLSGDLAELIIIGSALSTNDVASLENYLATEHNLPTGTNSYPVITQQPVVGTNANQGSTLTIVAAASGNPSVAYQWYDTNNVAVTGQTNATLVISNVQISDSYYLQATNIFGSVNSSNVAVNVISGLNVSLGPPSLTLYTGQSVTLMAVASGTVPFYYQWYQGASPIANATNPSYAAVAALGLTAYSCTVTNAYSGYSTTNVGPVSLIGIAAPTNLYQTTILGNNPMAYWRLNEVPDNNSGNGGTIANDYVGGHNATYTNVVLGLPGFSSISSTDTASLFGTYVPSNSYAGEIDQSSNGLANIDFATSLGGNAEFSIEAWVNITNATQIGGAGIVTKGYGNGGEQFDLDLYTGFRFFVRDASGATHATTSTVFPVTNQWYHLVGVWDGSSGAVRLYINGVDTSDTTGLAAGLGLKTATTTNVLMPQAALVSIGARTSSQSVTNYDLQFKGKIADVAIYNYALNPTQVHADYVAGARNAIFSTSSTNILFSAAANSLTLSWPADHTGWTLQAQTNNLSVGISTNWVNVSGSTATNQVVIPINLTNGSVFYRLIYQP